MPEDWAPLIGTSFISFMLSSMLLRAWMPFAPKRACEFLLQVPLGGVQRLLVHRMQGILLLLYVVLGSLPVMESRWFIPGTQPAAVAGLAVVLMLPLRYVFTTNGVALNNGVPRSYKDFRRYTLRSGSRVFAGTTTLILQGRQRPRGTAPSFVLFLPSSAVPQVTRLLKRYVR